jgi:hypothetical protein
MQLGARLDPELLDKDLARVAVSLERVGLATAAVERELPPRTRTVIGLPNSSRT